MHSHDRNNWQSVQAAFQKIWGYSSFRYPQGEIVQCLLNPQDALVVMPTGGGKSVCFQLPALLSEGLTLVVSPLVALMENQVQELCDRHLPAALLHSEISKNDRFRTLQNLSRLRLLYLSPETLLSPPVWEKLCQPGLVINGLILDEAHCLVQWGETFRPAYRRLGAVRPALLKTKPPGTKMAIAAFTATADPAAQQTIQQVLQLENPQRFRQSPYRSNLHLVVKIAWSSRDRRQKLLKFIQARSQQSGLVYVRTRKDGEVLASWLQAQGCKTAAYHGGLSPSERRPMETAWLDGTLQFVVCTSAFGMGINKPNVRWVVHFHAPILLSEYVQEVGRAGRDGRSAEALTLVSEPTGWLDPEDQQRQKFFLGQGRKQIQTAQGLLKKIPAEGDATAVARQFKDGAVALALLHGVGQLEWLTPFQYKLSGAIAKITSNPLKAAQSMDWYLKARDCRWKFLLEVFGFALEAKALGNGKGCGHCDRCLARR
ncbi:MAG: RecQ family ATP-dependent DNA helicase [Timaviella obliquedivisa GSE-PSE-MK23-08B]|jgi:ATP-dependent DNA helicase RecQ|nr:RecQ family ATP-dependent DNA helicase [Timaviella obliquedivisa GSE-PSE-MK23-08B]